MEELKVGDLITGLPEASAAYSISTENSISMVMQIRDSPSDGSLLVQLLYSPWFYTPRITAQNIQHYRYQVRSDLFRVITLDELYIRSLRSSKYPDLEWVSTLKNLL